jgi:hypothetical protein
VSIDYRRREHRREVFQKFYAFHLKYRSHPGAVYYVIPHLRERLGWTAEETLWYAFINGNTQHPVTSHLLHRRFPSPAKAAGMLNWFVTNYGRLAFDTDRRHHKKEFPKAVMGYLRLLRGRKQGDMWREAAEAGFAGMWRTASRIPSFGRLSTFSFCEYLRICGVPFDCDTLMLDDINGSKSHRNGLCKVMGMDEFDWHQSNPSFGGHYTNPVLRRLENAGHELLAEAKSRAAGQPYERDVSYFTMESALCTYKSWHRVNRRYPNVYNDMFYDRLKKAEAAWPDEDLSEFWAARRAAAPAHLLLEETPHDPGCVPVKQNHYRLTGQVIMMDRDHPEFKNDFNDAVDARTFPPRRERH